MRACGPSLNGHITSAGLLADLPLPYQWRFASLRDGLRPPLTPEPRQAGWAQALRGQGTPCPLTTAGYLGGVRHEVREIQVTQSGITRYVAVLECWWCWRGHSRDGHERPRPLPAVRVARWRPRP